MSVLHIYTAPRGVVEMKRLSKSRIEYLDYQWGFASGCAHGKTAVCPVGDFCWARKITERFRANYPKGFQPTIYPEALLSPLSLKKPALVGVCFMGDLFGDWVDPEQPASVTFPDGQTITDCALRDVVKDIMLHCPQHTFLFLTKAPWNLSKWGLFLDNCYIGVSVCSNGMMTKALTNLANVKTGKRWISFEPLLGEIGMDDHMNLKGLVDWVVIGAQTNPEKLPRIEWVREIVEAADKAGVKVWLKNNLKPLVFSDPLWAEGLVNWAGELRQELPG